MVEEFGAGASRPVERQKTRQVLPIDLATLAALACETGGPLTSETHVSTGFSSQTLMARGLQTFS